MYKHWAHAVSPSPWPLFMAFSLNATIWGFIMWIHWGIPLLMIWGLSQIGWVFTFWVRDIIREATFQGEHTLRTVQAFRLGFFLFILSEITFFGGFFWAYFYSSFIPSPKIGCTWPPQGIEEVSWKIVVFPTATLLWSGWLVSLAHWAVVAGNRNVAFQHLIHTIWLGMLFTYIQYTEYTNCTFSMANGIYASCFFLLMGFHGIHVIVGTVFLSVQYYRLKNNHFLITNGIHIPSFFLLMGFHGIYVIIETSLLFIQYYKLKGSHLTMRNILRSIKTPEFTPYLIISLKIIFYGGFLLIYFYVIFISSSKVGCTWPLQEMETINLRVVILPILILLWKGFLILYKNCCERQKLFIKLILIFCVVSIIFLNVNHAYCLPSNEDTITTNFAMLTNKKISTWEVCSKFGPWGAVVIIRTSDLTTSPICFTSSEWHNQSDVIEALFGIKGFKQYQSGMSPNATIGGVLKFLGLSILFVNSFTAIGDSLVIWGLLDLPQGANQGHIWVLGHLVPFAAFGFALPIEVYDPLEGMRLPRKRD